MTADQVAVLRSVLDQRRVGVRDHQATRSWPARTQLVLATNGETSAARLHAIADRVDLHLNLGIPDDLAVPSEAGGASALAIEQISRARRAAARRWSPNTPEHPMLNAEITPDALQRTLHLLPGTYLRRNADLARLSAQGWVGVLRLAWTIADLAGNAHPDRAAVDEAIAWRTGGLEQR
jgi:magnesium chelatase family protein